MTPLNCLIVDDEPIACDILLHYCSQLPFLRVVGSCSNALEAKQLLLENSVDVLFLDIQLPVLDGVSFMKTLKTVPHVVFTTAHREFALEAFDLAASDYLLKPFSLERFLMAIDKVTGRNKPCELGQTRGKSDESDFFIKADGNIYRIAYENLLFAEAKGNYTQVVTTSRSLLTAVPFFQFEKLLQSDELIRVHRSYIINLSRIDSIAGNQIFIDKHKLPIGSHYKSRLLQLLGI